MKRIFLIAFLCHMLKLVSGKSCPKPVTKVGKLGCNLTSICTNDEEDDDDALTWSYEGGIQLQNGPILQLTNLRFDDVGKVGTHPCLQIWD